MGGEKTHKKNSFRRRFVYADAAAGGIGQTDTENIRRYVNDTGKDLSLVAIEVSGAAGVGDVPASIFQLIHLQIELSFSDTIGDENKIIVRNYMTAWGSTNATPHMTDGEFPYINVVYGNYHDELAPVKSFTGMVSGVEPSEGSMIYLHARRIVEAADGASNFTFWWNYIVMLYLEG